MSDELVRKNLETSLQLGSLSSLASAAEVVFLLIDTSSSMHGQPIEDLRKVVNEINPKANGIPMIAFGGPYDAEVRFVDTVPDAAGGTPLHLAIPMAKEYGANRVIIISDGCPDLREQCVIEAQNFGGRIDVVYIGGAGDMGEFLLRQLAELTGGTCGNADVSLTKELVGKITFLLNGDVEETKSPIQGAGFTTVDVEEPDADDDESDDDDAEDEDDEEEDDDDADDE